MTIDAAMQMTHYEFPLFAGFYIEVRVYIELMLSINDEVLIINFRCLRDFKILKIRNVSNNRIGQDNDPLSMGLINTRIGSRASRPASKRIYYVVLSLAVRVRDYTC